MTAEQEEGVRYSERMGSWLEGLSLNLATTAAIDLEFRLKFSNPHFISTGYWWNFIIIIQLVLHIHGFYFHEFNPPQVKNSWKKKKNPESSEMQNLNVLYIGNDLPSIYMVFPASDIAFTFYQVL